MRTQYFMLLAVAILIGVVTAGVAQEPDKLKLLPEGVILIGAVTHAEPDVSAILMMPPSGEESQTLFRREGSIHQGRVSPAGDRLAFAFTPPGGEQELWVVGGDGEANKVFEVGEGGAAITAWSPDGKQIAFYRAARGENSFESLVLDLAANELKQIELPVDYVAEDWSPRENLRTAIYMNPRNRLYRPKKGDHYPTRQLDLLTAAGKALPITKNPCTDNIWSRFSPRGDQLAHYGRRLVGEKPLEYAVVCATDGSEPKEVFGFTEFGDRAGLPWFRPNRPPAWSPDGATLAWLVSTNTEQKSEGDQLEIVFVSAEGGGDPRRLSLTGQGVKWVSAVEWR